MAVTEHLASSGRVVVAERTGGRHEEGIGVCGPRLRTVCRSGGYHPTVWSPRIAGRKVVITILRKPSTAFG